MSNAVAGLLVMAYLPIEAQAGPKSTRGFGITPQQFWHSPFGIDNRVVMAGDADGDGRSDLIALNRDGVGVIEIARTSVLGKPVLLKTARTGFGKDSVAAVVGSFARPAPAADVLAVFSDGSIRVAWGMPKGANQYGNDDLIGRLPASMRSHLPIQLAIADFDNDLRSDVLCLDGAGNLLLLGNIGAPNSKPMFKAVPIAGKLPGVRQLVAGKFSGRTNADCVWLTQAGDLYRASISKGRLGVPNRLLKSVTSNRLVAGRFRGGKEFDLLAGRTLLPGGNPKFATDFPGLPAPKISDRDTPWAVADIDGNGKDDLVRFHRGGAGFARNDTFVHFSYDEKDAHKGYFCSSNDGLPDFWKAEGARIAGLNLAAMGCKVGRRDVIVEIERFDDVDEHELRRNMQVVERYFASLPIKNPDGTTGIAIHFIYKPAWPLAQRNSVMRRFDDIFPPTDRRGIVHTMFAENNGPLVSKISGDIGHFNGRWPEFIHEFGHQLDLRHEGFWSVANSPLYPSLMSYTYSYSLGDRRESIGYSTGALSSFVVNELRLSERLPFPYESVKFLAGTPYRYPLKPDRDGKHALIDWNFNGVFGEEGISADVNYSHGTEFGPRYVVGFTTAAPSVVVDHRNGIARPILFYAQAHRLVARSWLGVDRDKEGGAWSDEQPIDEVEILGDPTTTFLDQNTWIAYLTARGVVVRPLTMSPSGAIQVGPAYVVPKTEGCHPTLSTLDGKVALLLWKSPSEPVRMRFVQGGPGGITSGSEVSLRVPSLVPVAAAPGARTSKGKTLWITRMTQEGKTEAVQFMFDADNFPEVSVRSILDGNYARHRMALLWQSEPGIGSTGRLYHFSGGATDPDKPLSAQYITMNTAYPAVNGGWLYRRYNPIELVSASAPGACFFAGNIIYALRQGDDRVMVAFYGSGALPNPMGDFDDLSHIRDYGLSRSIRIVSE